MEKLILLNPSVEVSLHSDISPREKLPHIGLAYLSGFLKSKGFGLFVIDTDAENLSIPTIRKRIVEIAPDILGITASTSQIHYAHTIAKMVKEINKKIVSVIGGYHVSALPYQTMKEFPFFDFAVIGEGEYTFYELIESLKEKNLSYVSGSVWRKNSDIIINKSRDLISELDRLPFPYFGNFPLKKYIPYYSFKKIRQIPVSTSRGCPYKCIFCYRSAGDKLRFKSIDRVISEIERNIFDYSAEEIVFVDETFTIDIKRTLELCEEICRKKINQKIHWLCETRVDCFNVDLAKIMKKAGCKLIAFGIESGSENILKIIQKGITLRQAEDAINYAKRHRIKTDANFIIGHPMEEKEDILKTINFALSLNTDFVSFGILTPYPGTEVYKMAQKGEGRLRILTFDWRKYGKQIGGALELLNLDRSKLESLQRTAYIKFYLRLGKIKNLLIVANIKAFPIYILHQLYNIMNYKFKKLKNFFSEKL